jgi:carbon-monoxide dehydrogenase large subunit
MTARGRLAFDDDGRITACEADLTYDHGYAVGPSGGVSPLLCARMVGGPYDIPAIACTVTGVLTNKRPTTSYRGAGRPEATFLIESLIDKAARTLELTPIEIRRRNFIRPQAMPYRTGLADTFDCGEFENLMDKALEVSDWDGFAARRAASERQGRHRGRAIATFIEVCGVFSERMEIAVDRTGKVRISAGTFSHGQGMRLLRGQLADEAATRNVGTLDVLCRHLCRREPICYS